ncbi:hypothetical protein EVAR_45290_1 [Eumeta japonica]|uniref:Uncharacterized protein n=1 Tax=Eumeta variegata TaxID=151549 RepID=A0A4C1YCA8_EUMVA|nr:hypothetical protein EVAR_45290_1 [Eumeta japonica]
MHSKSGAKKESGLDRDETKDEERYRMMDTASTFYRKERSKTSIETGSKFNCIRKRKCIQHLQEGVRTVYAKRPDYDSRAALSSAPEIIRSVGRGACADTDQTLADQNIFRELINIAHSTTMYRNYEIDSGVFLDLNFSLGLNFDLGRCCRFLSSSRSRPLRPSLIHQFFALLLHLRTKSSTKPKVSLYLATFVSAQLEGPPFVSAAGDDNSVEPPL